MLDQLYVPERGDLIWLDFNPQIGREQLGRRPALVLSPKSYNQKVGLVIICPITSQIKGYPFEVNLTKELNTKGVIIADQVKSLDWKQRNAVFIEKVNYAIVQEVVDKFSILLA